MLHVIVVDDEIAALNRFERVASINNDVIIEGRFQYVEDAIDFVKENPIDVAFLDIEMPEMSGLEVAEVLMEIEPCIKVVFITAYDQYALNAFRAHAIGYLLKPLDKDEFTEQISHLICKFREKPTKGAKKKLSVNCFGEFSTCIFEQDSSVVRWKTAKAEELFALLIYYQGRVRTRDILIDTLWPELDPQKAVNLFRVTCTYLRAAFADIGFSNILMRELDGYKINVELINCDLFRFRLVVNSRILSNIESLERASEIYCGEYLEGKAYEWASVSRIGFAADFKKLQLNLANHYLRVGDMNKACHTLERVLQYDPYDEEVVIRIINIKLENGEIVSAQRAYLEYENALMRELGMLPSKNIQQLFAKEMG